MTVNAAFLEAGGAHEVGQGSAFVALLIEEWSSLFDNFPPGLLPLGHRKLLLASPGRRLRPAGPFYNSSIEYMRPNGLLCIEIVKAWRVAMSETLTPASAWSLPSAGPAINPWFIAITVTLATFMELLDTAIANVSLTHIAGGLAVSADESTWVLTSYLVSNAVVLPLSAWLSRTFGRKRYYMICVTLFTVSSLLCGFAPSLGALVFFRVLQGIGGGGLAPVEQAILVDTFPASKRAAAFALYSMAIVTAPAIGPPLGGWITDHWSWRWVFLINIPIGIVSLLLTSKLLSDSPEFKQEVEAARKAGRLKVDYLGILLIALGFACLEVVLDRGERLDWFESNFIVAFFAIAIVALVAAVVWERRQQYPVG